MQCSTRCQARRWRRCCASLREPTGPSPGTPSWVGGGSSISSNLIIFESSGDLSEYQVLSLESSIALGCQDGWVVGVLPQLFLTPVASPPLHQNPPPSLFSLSPSSQHSLPCLPGRRPLGWLAIVARQVAAKGLAGRQQISSTPVEQITSTPVARATNVTFLGHSWQRPPGTSPHK